MLGKGTFITILVLVLVAAYSSTSSATIYTFVDDSGVVHFSNVPTDPKYQPVVRLKRNGAEIGSSSQVLIPGYNGDWEPDPDAFDHLIRTAANRHRVDPHLVKAVIRAESNFDYLAVSRKGALGLMQLMPETASDMEVDDPFDPAENINGGTRYLRKMLGLFNGNLRLALAAYNAGPNRVISLGRVPKFRETVDYVRKVQYFYQEYQQTTPASKLWAEVTYDRNS